MAESGGARVRARSHQRVRALWARRGAGDGRSQRSRGVAAAGLARRATRYPSRLLLGHDHQQVQTLTLTPKP